MKAINQEDFAAELTKLTPFTDSAEDVNSFLIQYNSGLRALFDHHAPLSRRTFTLTPKKAIFFTLRRAPCRSKQKVLSVGLHFRPIEVISAFIFSGTKLASARDA
jgi:hypothetical protein